MATNDNDKHKCNYSDEHRSLLNANNAQNFHWFCNISCNFFKSCRILHSHHNVQLTLMLKVKCHCNGHPFLGKWSPPSSQNKIVVPAVFNF